MKRDHKAFSIVQRFRREWNKLKREMNREELVELEKELRKIANVVRSYRAETFKPDGRTRCAESGCNRWAKKGSELCTHHFRHTCRLCENEFAACDVPRYSKPAKILCPDCLGLNLTPRDIRYLADMEPSRRKDLVRHIKKEDYSVTAASLFLLQETIGQTDRLLDTSMGCSVSKSVCSVCKAPFDNEEKCLCAIDPKTL